MIDISTSFHRRFPRIFNSWRGFAGRIFDALCAISLLRSNPFLASLPHGLHFQTDAFRLCHPPHSFAINVSTLDIPELAGDLGNVDKFVHVKFKIQNILKYSCGLFIYPICPPLLRTTFQFRRMSKTFSSHKNVH